MAKIVRARYEGGVLKPLEKLDLREGEEVEIVVCCNVREVLNRYIGILGEAKVSELYEFEEEAQHQ